MVQTAWQWILAGPLGPGDCSSCIEATPFYYTTTILVEKRRSHWNYVSVCSFHDIRRRKYQSSVSCLHPKLFHSSLTFTVGRKDSEKRQAITVIDVVEVAPENLEATRHESTIVLFRNRTLRFITAAVLYPRELEVTYVFTLKLKCFDEERFCRKKGRGSTRFWIYRY